MKKKSTTKPKSVKAYLMKTPWPKHPYFRQIYYRKEDVPQTFFTPPYKDWKLVPVTITEGHGK